MSAPAVRFLLKEGASEWNSDDLWMRLSKYAELKDRYMKKLAAMAASGAASSRAAAQASTATGRDGHDIDIDDACADDDDDDEEISSAVRSRL